MGRRAKKAPVQTKKRPTLAKRFKCPFCANEETVECKMDFKAGIGSLACRLCAASFQMPIHHLSEPIDVFSEWLDDCEAAQHGRPPNASSSSLSSSALLSAPRNQYDYESDDDSEGDLPEASGLHNKPAAATTATATATTAASTDDKADARPSFTDLGLDDSDDDDDDDDDDSDDE